MPVGVIEILIAVSIFIAAIEAARSHNAEIPLKRIWYFVLVFGLLHGAGFASALAQIGLPQDRELPALFLFNIGIEFGQLLILAIALLAGSFGEIALQRLPGWFKRLACSVCRRFCRLLGPFTNLGIARTVTDSTKARRSVVLK